MKKRDYSNLANKTIYDVFTDEELEKMGFSLELKDKKFKAAKEDPAANARQFMWVWWHLEDKDLWDAIYDQFDPDIIPCFE